MLEATALGSPTLESNSAVHSACWFEANVDLQTWMQFALNGPSCSDGSNLRTFHPNSKKSLKLGSSLKSRPDPIFYNNGNKASSRSSSILFEDKVAENIINRHTTSIQVLHRWKNNANFAIVLDLQISNYIEQVSSDVGQLPRTRMFVVTTFFLICWGRYFHQQWLVGGGLQQLWLVNVN